MLLNSAITEQAELFSIKPIRLLCKYNTKANFTKSKISYNSEEEQRHFFLKKKNEPQKEITCQLAQEIWEDP